MVWFVSRQDNVHDRQHLVGDSDDGFAGSVLPLDPRVVFSHLGVVLSSGLSALG